MVDEIKSGIALMDFKLDDDLIAIFSIESKVLLISINFETELLNQSGVVSYDFMRAFHTIGSISGTMSFDSLSELSYAVERWAIPHVNRNEPILPAHLALVNEASLKVQLMIEDILASKTTEDFNNLVMQLHAIAIDVGNVNKNVNPSFEIPKNGLVSDNSHELFLPIFIENFENDIEDEVNSELLIPIIENITIQSKVDLIEKNTQPESYKILEDNIFTFEEEESSEMFTFGDDLPDLSVKELIETPVIAEDFIYSSEEDDEQEAILAAAIAEQEALIISSQYIEIQSNQSMPIADENNTEDLTLIISLLEAKNDADASVNDDIEPELLGIFYEECQGLLDDMREAIKDFNTDITNVNALHALKRALHTIKGGARMGGALKAGSLFHVTESMLDEAIASSNLSKDNFNLSRDKIGKGALLLSESFVQYVGDSATLNLYGLVSSTKLESSSTSNIRSKSSFKVIEKSNTGTVKISQKTMSDMLMISGETSILRSQIGNVIGDIVVNTPQLKTSLERLRKLIRDIELQGEIMISNGVASSDEVEESTSSEFNLIDTNAVDSTKELLIENAAFDPLQMDRFTKLQEIMRMASEAINDVESINLTLHSGADDARLLLEKHDAMAIDIHDMMTQAQLVPIDSMIGRFRKTVNQACRAVGKQARLEITGDGKMDRLALEKSAGAIDHILRNAVAHGIESSESRLLVGKLEEGVILITSKMDGDEAIIEITDDGAGINLMRVRAKAELNGLISANDIVSDNDVINMIFASGFSTAESVSEVSGRGVGLDAVKKDIEGMGGSVSVENSLVSGSKFSLRVRSTIATIHVLPIKANNFWYAIPASSISRVAAGVISEDRLSIVVDKQSYILSSVIGSVADVPEDLNIINCILIKDSNVAVYIDSIHQGRELVMKKLGKQSVSLPGVIGASIMDDGHTALIINPAKIVSMINVRQSKDSNKKRETRKKILVVDDSLTVRKVASRFLEREGFIVEVAIDGEDAMDKIFGFNPDIILSDIEMPRMDGFELVKLIRADSADIKNIPIIMISSRAVDKHIEFALSIGASAYFGKPYKEKELLEKIKQLLNMEIKEAA